jgi:hypothetical protein
MNCSASHFDGYEGIESTDGRLERSEEGVFIGKDAELARFQPYADACGNVLL